MLSAGGEPSGRVREAITRQIQAAETVVAGQPSLLQLKLPGASTRFDTRDKYQLSSVQFDDEL